VDPINKREEKMRRIEKIISEENKRKDGKEFDERRNE